MDQIVGRRLVEPWNELSATLAKLVAAGGGAGQPLPVPQRAPALAQAIVDRFSRCYELNSFSLSRAADLVVQYVDRLLTHARRIEDDLDPDALRLRLGEIFLQLRALICGASPILIDVTAHAASSGSFALLMSGHEFDVAEVRAFDVPTLSLRLAAADRPGATDPA